jgi:hypothetical protein
METVTCIAQRAASMRLINFTRQPFNSVCWLGQIHVQQICKYRMKLTFISGLMNEKRNECTPFINLLIPNEIWANKIEIPAGN